MNNNIKVEQLKQQVQKTIFYFEIKDSAELVKDVKFQLQKAIELNINREKIDEYSKMLVRLQLLRLALLKDEEAEHLIKENALEILNDPDLVLEERIEARQLTIAESLRHEMVNQPIMEALHQNTETIGSEKIFIAGESASVEPTIKNWLLGYDRTFGTGPQRDLTWLEYVKKNAATARLTSEEADTLRKVFKFYEFLKPEYIE